MKNEIKVRDLIKILIEFNMDAVVYIGDGELLKRFGYNNMSWNSNGDVSESDDSRKNATELYFTPSDSNEEQ